jgi:HEAT repeat protein
MFLSKSTPNIRKLNENLDIEGLINALNHKDIVVRKNAATALVEILDPAKSVEDIDKITSAIFRTVLNPHHPERFESALDSLTISCRDESDYVRWGAVWVLWILVLSGKRDPRIVDILIDVLKDPSPSTRVPAARGLGASEDRRAVDPLIEAAESPDRNEARGLTEAIGEALKDLGGPVDD